jgi:hypothetical protein
MEDIDNAGALPANVLGICGLTATPRKGEPDTGFSLR